MENEWTKVLPTFLSVPTEKKLTILLIYDIIFL